MSTAFLIVMDGAQQVPTVVSSKTGHGTAIFDSNTSSMSIQINFQGFDWGPLLGEASQTPGTTADDVTGVHIHNAARGVNGGIVLDWPGGGDADDLSISPILPDGSRMLSSIWETTDVNPITNFTGSLGSATAGADVPLYANIHTVANSGGEIRGQLVCIATDGANTVTGTTFDDFLPGLGGADTINGGAGNDTIDGGTGADTMNGGTGNDTYMVDNVGDVINESANEGTDAVITSVSYTLSANVENLTLQDGGAIDGTGNGLDNAITGNSSVNTLTGDAGNDTLNGMGGADVMAGGLGDDTYLVDNTGDTVTENANEGTDTVMSSVSYTLSANVENLTLSTFVDNTFGFGNSLANTITGDFYSNTLDGGAGADTLIGGLGNDSYYVDNTGDVVLENANAGSDTVYASASFMLSANVETLVLQGSADLQGYGSGQANTLYGNSGNNLLDGGAGADGMFGGAGDDVYFVDNIGDGVVENANGGNDSVFATASFTLGADVENLILQGSADLQGYGNGLANTLYGNTGNNLLNGGAGIDLMAGGAGDDVYFADDSSDAAFEVANQGNDTVFATASYGLAADVENLVLQGSGDFQAYGNNLANVIYGNSGNNLLSAGSGIDLMVGGAGNDIYYVDDSSDAAFEVANEGSDTVFATASYGLAADVENLILQGSGDFQAYGNSQANTIYGNSGSNLINGGGGADTMVGGAGGDVYFVDNAGDGILESTNEGNDAVFAGVSYALSANVEGLVLQGAGNISGTGNAIANSIVGNSGDNMLDGGGGVDQLTGNGGNDTFAFNVGETNGDTVVDFAGNGAAAGDSLQFVGFGAGATFTNIDATTWQVNYSGGTLHEMITFSNGAPIDPTDFSFI